MAGQTDEKEDCFPCNPTAKKVLEPFGHQVGGRCLIVAYDGETVCKELVPQEHRFYRHLPAELRPFTPRFKGSYICQNILRRLLAYYDCCFLTNYALFAIMSKH